jgi:hypothetical protein
LSETVPSASVHPSDLSLRLARTLIRRAVDKAEEIKMRGAIGIGGPGPRICDAIAVAARDSVGP